MSAVGGTSGVAGASAFGDESDVAGASVVGDTLSDGNSIGRSVAEGKCAILRKLDYSSLHNLGYVEDSWHR